MGAKTANRTCESCGGAMANRQSRQRNEKGQLVCDSCKANPQPQWTTTHGSLSVLDQSEMRRREAEAITSIVRVRKARHAGLSVVSHDSGDQAIINHCPFCGSGAVVGNSDGSAACDFCHSSFTVQVQPAHPFMPQTIDGESVVPPGMPGGEETELSAPSDPAVEEEGEDVAADPLGDADPNPPSHPNGPDGKPPAGKAEKPFPPKKPADKKPSGGGNQPPWLKNKKSSRTAQKGHEGHELSVVDASSGSILQCDTCRKVLEYTPEGSDEPVSWIPDRFKNYRSLNAPPEWRTSSYRTADGRTLDTEAYMARLALENADDRDAVLDQVRMANTQREAASVTCWRCKGEGDTSNGVECDVCGGTGLLEEKAAKTATLLDCPICQGTGEVEDKVNEREPSLTTYKRCTRCKGEGMLDINDPENFDLREPPHEASRKTADAIQEAVRRGMMMGMPEFTHPDAMLPGFAYVVMEPGPNGARPTDRKTTDRDEANRWAEELLARTDWSPYTGAAVRPFDLTAEAGVTKQAAKGLVRHEIRAEDIQEGDFLDISGKIRVDKRHPRTDKVLVRTQTTGARSPSVQQWEIGEQVKVWRRS